jgi:hypothetical protein
MARRNQYDPLQTVNQVMWLVIKDAGLGTALSQRPLPPHTDLKAALAAERLKFVDGGWDAGSADALFLRVLQTRGRADLHQYPAETSG